MMIILRSSVFACAGLLFLALSANAQTKVTNNSAKRSGNTAVIVVGSAAKGTWMLTKATGKYVVLPVAKTIFVKTAPAVGKFAVQRSAKYLLPMVVKLSVL